MNYCSCQNRLLKTRWGHLPFPGKIRSRKLLSFLDELDFLDWGCRFNSARTCAFVANFPLALGLSVPVVCIGSFGLWRTFLFWVSRVSAFVFGVCSAAVRGCVALFVGLAHVNAIAILIVGITGVVAPSLSWGFF